MMVGEAEWVALEALRAAEREMVFGWIWSAAIAGYWIGVCVCRLRYRGMNVEEVE